MPFPKGTYANTTASIDNNLIEGFTTYPNPITDKRLTISSSNSEMKQVRIYNILGKKVFSSSFNGLKKAIDVSTIKSHHSPRAHLANTSPPWGVPPLAAQRGGAAPPKGVQHHRNGVQHPQTGCSTPEREKGGAALPKWGAAPPKGVYICRSLS